MTFARLRAADWVALLAALALLFVMAVDWYSTARGEEARRIERLAQPRGAFGGEIERTEREEARLIAEGQEKNAWQAPGAIDKVIVALLLLTVALAAGAAFLRAAGRRFAPPLTPSALAALAATATALLVAYRLAQQPGLDVATTVRSGPPLALVALGVLALAAALGLRSEEAGRAFRELPERDTSDRERAAT